MLNRVFLIIVTVMGIAISCSVIFADIASNAEDTQVSETPLPIYEQILSALRKQTTVTTNPLPGVDPRATIYNAEAIIPPQCYTKTAGEFNPCYVCHQNPIAGRENQMNDGELQLEYSFSDVGMTNHFKNLFEDRSKQVAAISDKEIDEWINQDNYSALAPRLEEAGFKAWRPDLKDLHLGAEAFDEQGFAKDGSHWVAFNYKPFPSTFWPTNGATDDVMIRLSEEFRTDNNGNYNHDIYKANLAILEARVKGFESISSLPVDENRVGKDLNKDKKFTVINNITDVSQYVGAASDRLIDTYVYPDRTEFLHTVRYVGYTGQGEIKESVRMKEVRYMKKWADMHKMVYKRKYDLEDFHKEQGRLPFYPMVGDWGLDNEFAWSIHGFIEGHDGELRELTYEENLFCMGCHSSIGATIDKTFSFPRKVDGAPGWGYIDLKGMPDAPNMGEEEGEIATYLQRVGGGGEFRSNPEMFARWFKEDGSLDLAAVRSAPDVYTLITPSVERARQLNKAYKVIVESQDYIYGRDATVVPPANVYEHIDNDTAPTLDESLFFDWDIRLDWSAKN